MHKDFLNSIYFSASGTTQKCVDPVAGAIGIPINGSFNLADNDMPATMTFDKDDIVIVGAPVYGGRIPSLAADKLKRLQSNGARAIAIVVYGNRDYDDALLELTDILRDSGFRVIAAGAFIAQHSIFPNAGISRPDSNDIEKLTEFGKSCREAIERSEIPVLSIKGCRPYKKYGSVPFHPSGNKVDCKKCGKCSKLCPAEAIDHTTPWATNAERCISCGRCIVSCPSGTRKYRGLGYKLIGKIFTTVFARRREPEFFI